MLTQAVHTLHPSPHQRVGHAQWATGLLKGLPEIDIKGIEHDLIPYVGHLELANIPSEGFIIIPDVHGLLDSSCGILYLPTHNGEVVYLGCDDLWYWHGHRWRKDPCDVP